MSKNSLNLVLHICSALFFIATAYLVLNGFSVLMMSSTLLYLVMMYSMTNVRISLQRLDFITLLCTVLMTIRYYLYPFVFCMLMGNQFFELSESGMSLVVFLLEEFFTFVVMNKALSGINCGKYDNLSINASKSSSWLIILLCGLSIVIFRAYPSVAFNYQFIFGLDIIVMQGSEFQSFAESLGYVVIDSTRLLLPLVVINHCYRKYEKHPQSQLILYSFLACLLPMLIIKNMNRGSSLFTGIIYLWLVIRLYGWRQTKKYTLGTLLGFYSLLSVVSAVKHAMGIERAGWGLPYVYDMLQSYTLGIESIRYGLVTNIKNENLSSLGVFFNDIFGSLPILNRYADLSMRYTSLFNEVYYANDIYNKNDAIAPIITNLMYVFGLLGALIPAGIIYIAIKIYKKIYKCKTINAAFIYLYCGLVLQAGSTGSLSATIATLVWVVFPLYCIIKFMDKTN